MPKGYPSILKFPKAKLAEPGNSKHGRQFLLWCFSQPYTAFLRVVHFLSIIFFAQIHLLSVSALATLFKLWSAPHFLPVFPAHCFYFLFFPPYVSSSNIHYCLYLL